MVFQRGTGQLSTMGSQLVPTPSWKEEVNRRLAAHKSRRGSLESEPTPAGTGASAAKKAASEAAARVAARYAKAPTYSEMQAAEARAALRAAEVATRAALEAQVVAQAALDQLQHLHETDEAPRTPERPAPSESISSPTPPSEQQSRQPLAVRWDADLPEPRSVELRRASLGPRAPESQPNHQRRSEHSAYSGAEESVVSVQEVPAAQPIPANLIEFPRELVATRRMRPRLTGSRHDALSEMFGQLSIFEVDPDAISTEPPHVEETPDAIDQHWVGAEWSGIQLGDLHDEPEAQSAQSLDAAAALYVAPFTVRLLANVVDLSLIAAAVTAAAAWFARTHAHLPGLRATEIGLAAALLLAAALYYGLSLGLAAATPGMKFAGIALCTFEGECPTAAQIRARCGIMFLSLLPFGLGAAWALFDDDHLCWHNRTSRLYLRECQRSCDDASQAV